MDVVPAAKPALKSQSFRSRHGGSKVGPSVSGPPSPDSACEHDGWVTGNDMPEEGHTSTVFRRRCRETGVGKNHAGQDSDVDSGIVTCRVSGQRIGSTSSADTDSSQESRRRIEYSPPIQKSELTKPRSCTGSLRVPRRSSSVLASPPCGPIKGDHSALKECYRRPPTPLTVVPDSHHCVRFDEQLQLSEQNIRRSCRKLFATLYAQRFSYPTHQDSSLQHGRLMQSGSTRLRSRTVPELELRRYNHPLVVEDQPKYVQICNENLVPVERRSGSFSASSRALRKSISDNAKVSHHTPNYRFLTHPRLSLDHSEDGTSHSNSTDSGLGSLRSSTQCTCQDRHSSEVSSSQSTSNNPSECRCCSCTPQKSQESPTKLFKSSSCSTLTSVLSHQSRPHLTQFPPRTLRKMVSHSEDRPRVIPLHKTSSCSNLLDRTSNGIQVANIPFYNDNMVQVYARIASVIPEDIRSATSPSQSGSRRAKTLGRLRYTTDNVYDALWQSKNTKLPSFVDPEIPQITGRRASCISSENDSNSRTNIRQMTTFKPKELPNKNDDAVGNDADSKSTHSVEIYSQIPDRTVESIERMSLRESVKSRNCVIQRPKNVGVVVPNCGPNPVYLKSALKKPTQSAILRVGETKVKSQVIKPSEVEYAVVDKSKKNRFTTSLPALNGCNDSSSPAENEEKDPPIPPKKNLHKSDFSLYRSRSSSPKKSLLSRARAALQKAFSSERIYRPEKEERMEASKGLTRSRSFIKGLAGSIRRKKKRKNSSSSGPEIVPQASPNPEWDEQTLGPNSPIHVRGQLLQLNLDGSQVIELTKPPNIPYGFFVARGRVRNSKGVFVSRMRDQETQKQLSGLLDIGDEILEIDGFPVKNADIMDVNQLMAKKNTLLLTVLPYICRKDT